jgi:hypothetical protein
MFPIGYQLDWIDPAALTGPSGEPLPHVSGPTVGAVLDELAEVFDGAETFALTWQGPEVVATVNGTNVGW